METRGSPRVLVLLDHIESDYHTEILAGVRRGATRAGARLVIIAGGEIGSLQASGGRNFIYNCVEAEGIDGLVLLSGCLSNHEGLDAISSFVEKFPSVPFASIGVRLPGAINVVVDNAEGVQKLVEHLIVDHGHRRIAHLRGPLESAESDARCDGYLMALSKHGIPNEPRMIVEAGLLRADGARAMACLLDERGYRPGTLDAVVCVNDEAAVGAMDEMARRGLGVPRPFAVVGYDDAKFAQVANPPLTTVKQRAREQGEAALVAVIDALRGKAQTDVIVDAPLVLRDSCGCRARVANDSSNLGNERPKVARTCRLALIERRAQIVAQLARSASGRMVGSRDWEGRLVDALSAQIDSEEGGAFHWEFERLARLHAQGGGDPLVCHDVLTALRIQSLICTEVEPAKRPHLEDVFQEARVQLARVAMAIGQEHLDSLNTRMRLLVRSCLEQVGLPDEEALGRILSEHLPALGIESYAISRVGVGETKGFDLIAARAPGLRHLSSFRLPVRSLGIPEVFEQTPALVVEPLTYEGREVGVAVFSWGSPEPTIYEELRDLLGMVLYIESIARIARRSEHSQLGETLFA